MLYGNHKRATQTLSESIALYFFNKIILQTIRFQRNHYYNQLGTTYCTNFLEDKKEVQKSTYNGQIDLLPFYYLFMKLRLCYKRSKLLQWCETQKDCNRLRLIDILVRPMQRLTKYSLLLKVM